MFSSLRVDGEAAAAAYRASETLCAGSRARRFYAPERDIECGYASPRKRQSVKGVAEVLRDSSLALRASERHFCKL